jgi:hypothetical protein
MLYQVIVRIHHPRRPLEGRRRRDPTFVDAEADDVEAHSTLWYKGAGADLTVSNGIPGRKTGRKTRRKTRRTRGGIRW